MTSRSAVNAVMDPDAMISWKIVRKDDAVLTLWPGTLVREKDRADLMTFFEETFNVVPTIVGCVTTLPDKDTAGLDVPETGGRHDLFFYIDNDDVSSFALPRFQFGMRWWQDIYFNNGQDIYPPEFLRAFPEL